MNGVGDHYTTNCTIDLCLKNGDDYGFEPQFSQDFNLSVLPIKLIVSFLWAQEDLNLRP